MQSNQSVVPPPPFLFPLTSLTSLKRKFWPADTSAVTWKWSLCVCVCLFECVKWAGFPSQINALCDVAGGRFLSACCLTQPVCLPVASDQLNELWCPVLFSNPLEPVCLQPPPLCTRTHADQQRHEHSHSQTSETTAAPGFFLSPKRSNVEHVRTTKFTKWHFHRFIRGEWVSPWTSRFSAINDYLQNWMLPCMNLCLDTDSSVCRHPESAEWSGLSRNQTLVIAKRSRALVVFCRQFNVWGDWMSLPVLLLCTLCCLSICTGIITQTIYSEPFGLSFNSTTEPLPPPLPPPCTVVLFTLVTNEIVCVEQTFFSFSLKTLLWKFGTLWNVLMSWHDVDGIFWFLWDYQRSVYLLSTKPSSPHDFFLYHKCLRARVWDFHFWIGDIGLRQWF